VDILDQHSYSRLLKTDKLDPKAQIVWLKKISSHRGNMAGENVFRAGSAFKSLDQFRRDLADYEWLTNSQFYKRDARTLQAARKNTPRKHRGQLNRKQLPDCNIRKC